MPFAEDIPEDDELFDSRSTSTLRPTSSISSDSSKSEEKKDAHQSPRAAAPVKVLLVNGTCSEIFRSALENSVEDCILQYPGKDAVYVPKTGPAIPLIGENPLNSVLSLRQPSAQTRPSAKSAQRRCNSNQSLPPIGSASGTNRMRQQLVPQKFAIEEESFEETTIEEFVKRENPSAPLTRFSHPFVPSKKAPLPAPTRVTYPSSYRDRQKRYRLSDLVMLGPEHFADVFHLPRKAKPPSRKRSDPVDEFERIKEDLFHRYLWTKNPQVSCRISPISAYSRSATFAM